MVIFIIQRSIHSSHHLLVINMYVWRLAAGFPLHVMYRQVHGGRESRWQHVPNAYF